MNWNWGGSNNNGNLQSAGQQQNGPGYSAPLTFSQSYGYDGINRLTSVTDTGYSRAFSYDAFGNLWVNLANTTVIAPMGQTSNVYNANNQITMGATGGSYDPAGNETGVNGNTITYDAENRQTGVTGAGVAESYAYDADGKRA